MPGRLFRVASLALSAAVAVAALVPPTALAQDRDVIRVAGSSTMFRMSARVAEEFGRTRMVTTPVVESTGTGGGFKLFCQGIGPRTPDLVAASRLIAESEAEACAANDVRDVIQLPVGYGGVVAVTGHDAPDFDLTRRHIWLAIAERVPVGGALVPNPYTSWRDIDPALPDLPILVYGPPPTSGTRDALVGMVMEPPCLDDPVVQALPADDRLPTCMRLREDGAYVAAGEFDDNLARRVVANPKAVGIVGFHVLEENLGLKAADIDGVEPSFASILDGRYPLIRSLYIYVKGDHVGRVPGLKAFVQAYVSDAAIGSEGYLTDMGLVPLPPAERAATQRKAAALPEDRM